MTKEKQNYLFVCYANENRSPTAEEVCRKIARRYGLGINAGSAGMSKGSNRPLKKEIADKADKIFVMEDEMVATLVNQYGQNPVKILCLNIPDIYGRDDPWLIGILEDKLYEHFAAEGMI